MIRGLTIPLCAWMLAAVPCTAHASGSENEWSAGHALKDENGDAVLRRTDLGADAPVNPPVVQGRLGNVPDVISLRWGGWTLSNSYLSTPDPYSGSFNTSQTPSLVRIDVTFNGVINPPGPLGVSGFYTPYMFGNSPLYGFIDIDLDGRRDTGGELGAAALSRYLAVVARFGQLPSGSESTRVARSGTQLDQNIFTSPQYERSGAEFSMVFCGCFTPTIVNTFGDYDGVFGPGDTWIVRGRFFQRAGGFQNASAAYGGSQGGLYDPLVDLRFHHDFATDTTTVSLVYPVTQSGAARLRCGFCPSQPRNLNVADDTSIDEAMHDVCEGAMDPFLPVEFPDTYLLVGRWGNDDTMDALDPAKWVFHAVFATAYSEAQSDAHLVWTDAGFSEKVADFNASGQTDIFDRAALTAYVWSTDGTGFDCDGMTGGRVHVCNFGPNFSVFDLNYDGVVDAADAEMVTPVLLGDFNGDCAVTTTDLVYFLGRFGNTPNASVLTGDLNGDGVVNTADLTKFLGRFGKKCQ